MVRLSPDAGIIVTGSKNNPRASGGENHGTLLLAEQAANLVTRIDAQGDRSTFLEKTAGAQGLTFDQKGRLIGVLPATKQIDALMPTRIVLASAFEGRLLAGPNDLVAVLSLWACRQWSMEPAEPGSTCSS